MSRDIKFRAWDGIRMTTSGIMFNCSTSFLEIPSGSKMKIMQYIGLKDKHGTDIYENDLFQVAANKVYQVKFCDGKESNHEWYGGAFILWLDENTFFPFDDYAIKTGKVIGNIYDNPEYLKK